MANPWDRLPNYWPQLVDGVATFNADYDHNGAVDAADYVIWRKTQQQTGAGLDADGNGDRAVDFEDLAHWRRYYGRTTFTAGAGQWTPSVVPEPAGIIMATTLFGPLAAAYRQLLHR